MSSLVKSSILLSAALVLGRVFGFLREVLLAARVGVSAEADIAVVILTLPEILVGILLWGGFAAALVPALKRRPDNEGRDALFSVVATWAVLAGGVLALPVLLFPGGIFGLLAPTLPDGAGAAWRWAIMLSALAIPLAALAGALGGYLNAKGTFFAVGLGAAAYNIVLCLVLIPVSTPTAVLTALALGVPLAAVIRLLILWRAGKAPRTPRLAPVEGADLRFAKLFASGVLAVGLVFLAHLVFRTIAASQGQGELAAFAYALKLYQLPVGLALAPIATVLLPRLSEGEVPSRLVRRALAVQLGLALLILAVGLIAGERIATLIFLRGEMTAEGLSRIVTIATWMFFALPFAAMGQLGAALLNARQQTHVVFQNTALALLLGGGLALLAPSLLLPAFVLFHATVALLNLWRARTGLL